MNKTLKSIYVMLAACFVASPLVAQQSETVTLQSCLEKGLENNYSLRIVRNEEQKADNNFTRANAGQLPTLNASVGYSGTLDNTKVKTSSSTSTENNVLNSTITAGITAEWMVFDGFKMQADYQRLRELHLQSETQTRIAVEDYIAELTSEYYNFVQQRIRMHNLNYAVRLSKERLRIVQERYAIGNNSRLDLFQAEVDFNADSAQSLKQHELLASSRIRLRQLMSERNMDTWLLAADTAIAINEELDFDSLWDATLLNNASLLKAAHERTLADVDMRSVRSRDFPYLKLRAGYGYTQSHYGVGTTKRRQEWGADFGLTIGMKLFDGKRRSQMRNARLAKLNAELEMEELELSLYANLADLWQAYKNNLRLLSLERQNLYAAQENHNIAHERYLLGDLSGIEMREAQKSLLDAEERILAAEYGTKICEISLLQISGGVMGYLK